MVRPADALPGKNYPSSKSGVALTAAYRGFVLGWTKSKIKKVLKEQFGLKWRAAQDVITEAMRRRAAELIDDRDQLRQECAVFFDSVARADQGMMKNSFQQLASSAGSSLRCLWRKWRIRDSVGSNHGDSRQDASWLPGQSRIYCPAVAGRPVLAEPAGRLGGARPAVEEVKPVAAAAAADATVWLRYWMLA